MSKELIKIGLGLVFVSILLWFFVFNSLISDISLNKNILAERVAEYEEQKQKNESLKALEVQYEKLDEEVKQVNTMLPSTKDYPNLLIELPALIRKSGFSMESISLGSMTSEDGGSGIQEHEIGIKLAGSYRAFRDAFLRLQEQDLRLMDVGSINISPAKSGNYNFIVDLVTYYQP